MSSEEFHHWFPNLNNYCMQIQVCAVGWEPNPAATKYLKKLEASYQRCGFRVKINTETGVGIQNTELKFVRMTQVNKSGLKYIFDNQFIKGPNCWRTLSNGNDQSLCDR